jgi:xanthine dehydrogenase YagS FAD-binding subunit
MLSKFSYKRAATIKEAIEAAARPGAQLLAGGTDLVGSLRSGTVKTDSLVSLRDLKELRGISATPAGGLRIGALTTLAEVASHADVRAKYAAVAQAAASAASPQIRNQGTLGGNLCQRPRCWYFRGDFNCRRKGGETCFAELGESQYHAIFGPGGCYFVHPSDTAPALAAFDARLTIVGRKGRRTIPVSSFFVDPKVSLTKENVLAPGEILTEVLLDPPRPGVRSTYRKIRERGAFDFAVVSAAVVVTMSGNSIAAARIVLGGVAPTPWRATEAEKALTGKSLEPAAVAETAAAAVKGADPFEKNRYKVLLIQGMLEDTLLGLKV